MIYLMISYSFIMITIKSNNTTIPVIKKYIPEFRIDYDVDQQRQNIAESWPNSLDDSEARAQWGWKPKYLLDDMTKDMLEKLKIKLKI